MTKRLLLNLCAVAFVSSTGFAGDWPSWRGPHGDGTASGTGFPVAWNAEKNVAWKHAISGLGASTPAVNNGLIFLTSVDKGQNLVTCLDFDGSLKWQTPVGAGVEGKPQKDGTGANPSPVATSEHVFVYFKSGQFACLDRDGKVKWQSNLFERFSEVTSESLWWDLGTSPVLTNDCVVVTLMHSGPSWLVAFEQQTGKLKWKHDRVTDAPVEAAQSYTTPIVTNTKEGQEVIIVTGADHVTCHSAIDGAELWRVGGLNPDQNGYFRSISSSVSANNMVVAPYARGGTLTAIRMGGAGDVTKSHVVWTREETSADVPTPTIANKRVYVVRDVKQDRGTVDCLDLMTGKTIWTGQLPRHRLTFRASPIYADGRLYVTRQDGTVFVLDADGDEFRLLSENRVADEHTVATPVLVDASILQRTERHVYMIR